MIDLLVKKNNELLKKYEDKKSLKERQLIISNILKRKDCFWNLRIEDAYNILKDLEISNYEEFYLKLISYEEYKNL